MASGGEQITGGAVEALLGVVTLDADASEGDEAVVRLAEAVRAAADTPGIAVWIHDQRLDAGRLVASPGLSEDAWEALAAAAEADRPDERRRGVAGGDGALPAALADAGASHAAGRARGRRLARAGDGRGLRPARLRPAAAGGAGGGRGAASGRCSTRCACATTWSARWPRSWRPTSGCSAGWASTSTTGPPSSSRWRCSRCSCWRPTSPTPPSRRAADPESLRPALGRIYETVGGALHEMRELIGHLRPAQFEDRTPEDILGDALAAFEARADCRGDVGVRRASSRSTGCRSPSASRSTGSSRRPSATPTATARPRLHVRAAARTRAARRWRSRRRRRLRPRGRPAPQARACPWRASACTACATGPRSWAAPSTPSSEPGRRGHVRVFLPRWHGPAPEVAVMWPEAGRVGGEGVRPDGARRGRGVRRAGRLGHRRGLRRGQPPPRGRRAAAAVLAAVPARVARVGVFVGASPAEMAATARRAGLTHLQIHGDADPAEAARGERPAGDPGRPHGRPAALARARASAADLVLLDAAVRRAARRHRDARSTGRCSTGEPLGRPFALAGGLTARERRPRPCARIAPGAGGRVERGGVGARAQGPRARARRSWRRSPPRASGWPRERPDHARRARSRPATGRSAAATCPRRSSRALDELTRRYLAHRDDVAFRAELRGPAERLRRAGRRRSTAPRGLERA